MADVRRQIEDEVVGPNGALTIQGYQPAVTSYSSITATGAQTSVAATGLNIATLTLRTFTGTSPSITFKLQGSDDNTNWVDLQGINNNSGLVGNSWTQGSALTAGTAGPSIDYTIGAYTNVRINVTAIAGASATAAFGLAMQTMPYEASPGVTAHGFDGANPQRLKTDTSGQLLVTTVANSTGGWSKVKYAAQTTTVQTVKGTAGTLGGYFIYNPNASVAYVQIFDVATATTVTLGTTSPDIILPIPATGGANLEFANGVAMANGIKLACTTTATGSTAPGTGLDMTVFYK